jgi:hypothetical protein
LVVDQPINQLKVDNCVLRHVYIYFQLMELGIMDRKMSVVRAALHRFRASPESSTPLCYMTHARSTLDRGPNWVNSIGGFSLLRLKALSGQNLRLPGMTFPIPPDRSSGIARQWRVTRLVSGNLGVSWHATWKMLVPTGAHRYGRAFISWVGMLALGDTVLRQKEKPIKPMW